MAGSGVVLDGNAGGPSDELGTDAGTDADVEALGADAPGGALGNRGSA
jgi:hypothetical protein